MKKLKNPIAKYFKFQGNKTNYSTELRVELVTILAMCYILAVNPNILSALSMSSEAVFLATAPALIMVEFLMMKEVLKRLMVRMNVNFLTE